MNHLNEDKLIQYAFDLMEPGDKKAAQQHLDDCAECRTALDALKRKFAVMDTLTGEMPPSEELIQQTLAKQQPESQAQGYNTKQTIPLYRRRWVEWSAAAAAIAIVCLLMFQNQPKQTANAPAPETQEEKTVAMNPDAPKQEPSGPFPDDRMATLSLRNDADTKVASKSTKSSLPAKGEYPEGGRGFEETAVRVVAANEIPDKPPFAPASAIELVVLPKPDKTQVTIYNSKDLTLVRDTRKLTLKPGWNWLQFMWDNTQIDPTSLSLTPLAYADKVHIQLISYPAHLKDVGRWLIRSEVEGAVPFEITYFASGLSWRAFYMGTMNEDETTMDLKGYVNVSNNSGQDFLNAQTRLIVGETRLTEEISYLAQRRYPYGPYIVEDREGIISNEINFPRNWKEISNKRRNILLGAGIAGSLNGALDGDIIQYKSEIKSIEKTGLSEYFLYTIEGTENLTNQWTKRLPSFDIENIPVKSLYKYDEDRYGTQPVRFVSFANDSEHELGETPIPEGLIKIYRNVNEAKNLSYIGGSAIKYIPINEDIELNLGPARLVKVEPILIEQKTENYTFDKHGNIDGWDDIETYKVMITNTRDIPIDIEITWNMGTDAWELTYIDIASIPENAITYKKHDRNRARFTMMVRPQSKKDLPMTIRKYHQKRIEAYVEKEKESQK